MHEFFKDFSIFLLAINLICPMLSLTIIQDKSLRQNERHGVKNDNDKTSKADQLDCLPENFELTDIVSYRGKQKSSDEYITIKDKLMELKAQCREGILVDGKGREIRFFKLACYGNPPSDFDEIARKEREDLDKLQKHYTVIILECDPRIS